MRAALGGALIAWLVATGCASARPPGICTANEQCTGGRGCFYLFGDPTTDPRRGRCVFPPDPRCDVAIACGLTGVSGFDDRAAKACLAGGGAGHAPAAPPRS